MKKSTPLEFNKRNKDPECIIIIFFYVIVEYDVPSPHFEEVDVNWGAPKGRLANQKCAVVLDSYPTQGSVPECMILCSIIEYLLNYFWWKHIT